VKGLQVSSSDTKIMNCPLCKCEDIKLLEVVDKGLLSTLYEKRTKIDFSYLITENLNFFECQKCKLRFFNPLIIGDEAFYNSLQKFDWYYLEEKSEYDEAIKYISSTDKVLDVGSGKGAFSKILPTKDYVGLDFSLNAKLMGAKDGILIENKMIQEYADMHPSSFDVVASFQVLEHVSEPASFIEAKIKALKSGGKLIISVPSEDSFLRYVNNGIFNMPPHHVTRWSDDTLKFIAEEYNLHVLSIFHEKVQDVHKTWFLSTLVQSFFLENQLLNNKLYRKVIIKLAGLFSRFALNGLKDEMLPNGHSVTVVYVKK